MRRGVDDRARLLHGPYQTPALRVGDRATCLYRDCDVIVTSWTDAPISWPRCKRAGGGKGHPSVLVDGELERAIRTEAAVAVRYWWGVSIGLVHDWRTALGVKRMENPGSRCLTLAASDKGAAVLRGAQLPAEQVERRRQTALELNLGRNLVPGYHGPWWTEDEVALLGKIPDQEVVKRTGRPWQAVRKKREALGIPNSFARPGAYGSPPWTAEEDRIVLRLPPAQAALRTGRTISAIYNRRHTLRRR
jgi:hypothetical protein